MKKPKNSECKLTTMGPGLGFKNVNTSAKLFVSKPKAVFCVNCVNYLSTIGTVPKCNKCHPLMWMYGKNQVIDGQNFREIKPYQYECEDFERR